MTFIETKPAVQSKAVVGSSVSLVSILAAFIVAKTQLPPEIVNELVVPLLAAGIGNVVALVGRLFANTGIGGIFK